MKPAFRGASRLSVLRLFLISFCGILPAEQLGLGRVAHPIGLAFLHRVPRPSFA
jgi:hypothetical protein